MQDAWCTSPTFLSFKTLVSCLEYQASGIRTWPSFQENVRMGAVAGYLLPFQNGRFYASQHYRESYAPINIRHVLDVVLHDGSRPFGAFLMMRSELQGPFIPDERSLFAKLIPIMTHTFSVPSVGDTQYSEKETTGFALFDQNGKYESMNEEARRITWMLTHTQPGAFADPNTPPIEFFLEQLISKQRERIKLGEKIFIDINNRWGRFILAFEQDPKTLHTIVNLRRRVPFASQLAFYLAKLNLPPVRQIVAWLLTQNQSRNEIAVALDISVETVTDHIKRIYKETGASSSHGLLIKLSH